MSKFIKFLLIKKNDDYEIHKLTLFINISLKICLSL